MTIVTVSEFCRNFPRKPKKLICRENLFEHVDAIFKEVTRIVYLEGAELTGKTEFLAGYMNRHPENTIGIFLNPSDSYFYTPEYLRLVIAEQIHWLTTRVPTELEFVDSTTFQGMLHKLQKLARKAPITFVIDGLAEPDNFNQETFTEMLNSFPFGQNEFRFLISGTTNIFDKIKLNRHKPKPFTLVPIGSEEAIAYFQDIENLSNKDISDIRRFCHGTVGLLVKFRSLLEAGSSLEQIFEDKEGGLTDLLEMEWDLDSKIDNLQDLLAILCFSNKQLTTQQLSSLGNIDLQDVSNCLRQSKFVELDAENIYVSIRSAGEKTFLQKKLKKYEQLVQNKLIEDLLKTPDSIDAVRYLPAQLMAVGHYDDLIQRLDNKHFVKLLESEHSLGALKRHSAIGLSASEKNKDDSARFRFGLSGSSVSGLALSASSKIKIEAIIKLGDSERAIELAMLAPTKEERLKLLGATAKAMHANQYSISADLKQQINQLLEEVDIEALGHMATDIACDILTVDFRLATELFQKSQKYLEKSKKDTEKNADNSIDQPSDDNGKREASLGEVQIRPNERHSRRFANAMASLVERVSVNRILSGDKSLEPRDELMMLKQWIKKRRRDSEAWKVADYALDVALKDLSRAPRIEDFRSIAVVLPYIQDIHIAERLVKRIEAQLGTELTLGTSIDSIRLELLIERVRYQISPQDSELSLISIYSKIDQITDISVKAACLAWMLYSLQHFSDPIGLEIRTTLVSETTKKLIEAIDVLLASSADHLEAAKGAIHALARANVVLAFDLISRLNTKSRRDMGYSILANELISAKSYVNAPGAVLRCFSLIKSEDRRSACILQCLGSIAVDCEANPSSSCDGSLLDQWQKLRVANYRFQAVIYSYRILMCTTKNASKEESLRSALEEIWPHIMVDWVRTDLGYLLVRDLFKINKDFARDWLKKLSAMELVENSPSDSLSQVLHLATNLAIRCYPSVASLDCDGRDLDFSRVAHLINSVPTPNKRLELWCDLGIKLHYFGKHSWSKRICSEQVQTILEDDFCQNEFVRETLIIEAAPLLYLNHAATSIHMLGKISDPTLRDKARRDICDVILRRSPLNEPFRYPDNREFDIDQNDAASIIDILKSMDEDIHIFPVIKDLCASLPSKRNESKLRRTFVQDCLNSLQEIIDLKLPYAENIKHNGYKIAATAYIYKAKNSLTGSNSISNQKWISLFTLAKLIPNVADRAVVFAMIVSCAKSRASTVYPNWFSEIKSDISSIPTYLDRIDRYQWIAETIEPFDRPHASILLQEGLALTSSSGNKNDTSDERRRMLDLAHSIDPDLVDKLIDTADKDKASTSQKEDYTNHRRLKDIQKTIADNPNHDDLLELTADEISDICFNNLGALNAKRIPSKSLDDFDRLSSIASGLPMLTAYPIWSWIIENSIRKAIASQRNDQLVRPLFVASCNAGELILSLIGRTTSSNNTSSVALDGLVRPGDRDFVIDRISSWAQETNGSEIRISDPFFGPDDIEVIYRISESAPDSKITILTSKKHIKEKVKNTPPEDAFYSSWVKLYDIDPPEITIGVVGLGNDGGHPIHDRWIVSADSGLRLGTSANSIGLLRMSEISTMDTPTARSKFDVIGNIATRETRTWDGIRLNLNTFDLF